MENIYIKLIVLASCAFAELFAIDESLYTCSGWNKVCKDGNFTQAEPTVIAGEYFSCYIDLTPNCFFSVPSDVKDPETFCQSLDSKSHYIKKDYRCEVKAEKIDDDADHFPHIWSNF